MKKDWRENQFGDGLIYTRVKNNKSKKQQTNKEYKDKLTKLLVSFKNKWIC